MKKIYKFLAICLMGVSIVGCSDDDNSITPSEISNLRYESTAGRIVLRWDTPQDGSIKYIQVNYHDPLLQKESMRMASVYADSLEVPNTRKKFGEYKFIVKTVSPSGQCSNLQEISAVSQPAEKTWIPSIVNLKPEMLSTNAQEPSEGPIENLLDDNTGTFFHTAWSEDFGPDPHNMQIALPKAIDTWWQFYYAPRNNGGNKPTDFDMEGSMDGNQWFLIKNFTKEEDGLPTDSKTTYTSERLNAETKPFKYLRMTVYDTNTHTQFWTMSEFKLYTFNLIDPEADDAEE